MPKVWLQSLLALLVFTLLTGIVYPLAVTGIAQLCCRRQAQGSLIRRGSTLVGSALLGQPFDRPDYFWPRPSATTPQPYNGASSGGSNLGPTNPAQIEAVQLRVHALQQADPANRLAVPVDLVTASGSGLDPHISPAAALYQVARVARARGLDPARVRALVTAHTQGRDWGLFGEPRVNVLQLNVALDALHSRVRRQ
ncbi:MAG TPA: potassium-transporting ATPase subunit KdpC [Steroidobacteraceae bacterium]|jgi:K+-transporting ATPase ATPase C chain|nr:potassium-transporting ATPase subunit KdpC [Steroidobacteraceae bacterium]